MSEYRRRVLDTEVLDVIRRGPVTRVQLAARLRIRSRGNDLKTRLERLSATYPIVMEGDGHERTYLLRKVPA